MNINDENDTFIEWNQWLDVIYRDITNLSIARNVFWEVQEIIQNNPKIQKPSSFYKFLGDTYVAYAVMAIRRQIKIANNSISFCRFLNDISNTPQVLSRERFVALYRGTVVECFADKDFEKFAGNAKNHIDPDLVKTDLDDLKVKAKKCEYFADKRIAHFDKNPPRVILNFKEIDNCIDLLERLTKKYFLLFRAENLSSILPVYQYDWKEIFREAWLPKR